MGGISAARFSPPAKRRSASRKKGKSGLQKLLDAIT
jgi:hypothetical protein